MQLSRIFRYELYWWAVKICLPKVLASEFLCQLVVLSVSFIKNTLKIASCSIEDKSSYFLKYVYTQIKVFYVTFVRKVVCILESY